MTSSEFIQYFTQFGKLQTIFLPKDPNNPKHNCGFGFVTYIEADSVRKVVKNEKKHVLRAKIVFLTA